MTIVGFDPISAAIGGALIGLAVTLMMLLTGRVAGVAGVAAEFISPWSYDRAWRLAFLLGLVAAPFLVATVGYAILPPPMAESWALVIVSGLLVGFGSRLGTGCTSGHGICGIARLSPRSITATMVFMAVAVAVVVVTRHWIGR
jgi:uncharacterized membrane protein YedE/YeeE